MEARDVVLLVAAIAGSGGLFGGIYALMKLRPEAGQMTVSTAQGVLSMQSTVLKQLQESNEQLALKNERLQDRIDALEAENSSLMRRLSDLERRLEIESRRHTSLEGRMSAEERRNTGIEEAARISKSRADAAEKREDKEG